MAIKLVWWDSFIPHNSQFLNCFLHILGTIRIYFWLINTDVMWLQGDITKLLWVTYPVIRRTGFINKGHLPLDSLTGISLDLGKSSLPSVGISKKKCFNCQLSFNLLEVGWLLAFVFLSFSWAVFFIYSCLYHYCSHCHTFVKSIQEI